MSSMLAQDRPDRTTAVVNSPGPQRKRVVIVGGGFAGLAAAQALRHAYAEVILIDRRNHHIFQPLLYQVATAAFLDGSHGGPFHMPGLLPRGPSPPCR